MTKATWKSGTSPPSDDNSESPKRSSPQPNLGLTSPANTTVEEVLAVDAIPDTGPGQARQRTNRWRIHARSLALTFPQTECTKEQALLNILEKWDGTMNDPLTKDVDWVVLAQELHADGHHHLHIGIKFKSRHDWRNCHFADFICGKHGNYEVMGSQFNWLRYLCKADPEPLCYCIDVKVLNDIKRKITAHVFHAWRKRADKFFDTHFILKK